MLAKPDGGRLRSGPEWAYEYKLDGYRAAMRIAADGTTVLTSRNGIDFTDEFASLAGVLAEGLDGQAAVLVGEIVVYNEAGQVEFGLLQERRGRYQRHRSAGRSGPFEDVAVRFVAFDLLRLGEAVLLGRPYDERRHLLSQLPMPDPYRVSVIPAFTFEELAADRVTPAMLLDRMAAEGKEGLVAKLRNSTYLPGRRPDSWLKHPLVQTQEVIVCGWRPGQNRFAGMLGGLLLGGHDPVTGDVVYLGDVGTGFSEAERRALQARLEPSEIGTHPFAVAPPREDVVRARWVRPELVGEVQYRQFTRGAGRLRHTSWRGLRADRNIADVVAPRSSLRDAPPAPAPPDPVASGQRITVRVGERQLAVSSLDKVLYPAEGFTKAEVISYYAQVAPVMLPHLAARPVTFIRFPDGVEGGQFFEKNVARGAPDWLSTVALASTGSRGRGETIEYVVVEELAALVWAANLAALELHVPQWTVTPDGARGLPDPLVFDLDPGPGTTVVECADGLTPRAQTSGSKGMQVYCGIHTDSAQAPSAYAKAVAMGLARQTPDRVTATMAKAARTGRVFVDWSQNNPHKTTIAPYSLRGREHPTVSTPVTWEEVRACDQVELLTFTAEDVLHRVDQLGDVFADLGETRAALPPPVAG
jgi:bifunctional non-homologous end joining protein LigD